MANIADTNGTQGLVEAVAKLIQLTQEGTLKWKPIQTDAIPVDGLDYERVEAAYEAVLAGSDKTLRLYKRGYKTMRQRAGLIPPLWFQQNDLYPSRIEEIVLQNVDDNGNGVYTFPRLSSISNLLEAVQYQSVGKELLKTILAVS